MLLVKTLAASEMVSAPGAQDAAASSASLIELDASSRQLHSAACPAELMLLSLLSDLQSKTSPRHSCKLPACALPAGRSRQPSGHSFQPQAGSSSLSLPPPHALSSIKSTSLQSEHTKDAHRLRGTASRPARQHRSAAVAAAHNTTKRKARLVDEVQQLLPHGPPCLRLLGIRMGAIGSSSSSSTCRSACEQKRAILWHTECTSAIAPVAFAACLFALGPAISALAACHLLCCTPGRLWPRCRVLASPSCRVWVSSTVRPLLLQTSMHSPALYF